MKFVIQFAFDGSDYCGWQIQRGVGSHENTKPSIEGTLRDAIKSVCRETVTIVASGRTDAGVHASRQVAHFELEDRNSSDENLLRGLNQALPDTIQIHELKQVPDSFRAQHAVRKQYSYYFQQGPSNLPHLKAYTMWNRHDLNGQLMHEAAQQLIGDHDFAPFGSARSNVSSTIRHIHEADVTREPISKPGCFDPASQYLWRVRIIGSGFLMHMMRSIAGTLKQIGEEQRPPDDIQHILRRGNRQEVGPTAPSSGLWLDRVWYEPQSGAEFLE